MPTVRLVLSTVLALVATSASAQPGGAEGFGTGDEVFEAALGYAIPFAKEVVARGDALVPFGLALTAPALPTVVQTWDDSLTGQEAVALTVETMRAMAVEGLAAEGAPSRPLVGSALVLDILTDVPGREGKTDAIAVIFEAPGRKPTSYVLPYVRDGRGGIAYLDPYTRPQPSVLIP